MGWDALSNWGTDAVRLERLTGGVANDVWRVRVRGHAAVARLGTRSDADLAWETELLQILYEQGLYVPLPIATDDCRLFANGMLVMNELHGAQPKSIADWQHVADTLRHLHRITRGWPQRPGWRSSIDLLDENFGTKVDLTRMPAEGVARCRAAWARLKGQPPCVVHGDPNPRNILIDGNRVGLIDWDEARVDVPLLDLILPKNAGGLDRETHDIASQASAAWEAAVCWDDAYAHMRLSEVRAV